MDELMKLAFEYGFGPIVTVMGAAWYMMKSYNKRREAEHAEEIRVKELEVAARTKENELRRMGIRQNNALLKFLKEQGHDVQIPDLITEV